MDKSIQPIKSFCYTSGGIPMVSVEQMAKYITDWERTGNFNPQIREVTKGACLLKQEDNLALAVEFRCTDKDRKDETVVVYLNDEDRAKIYDKVLIYEGDRLAIEHTINKMKSDTHFSYDWSYELMRKFSNDFKVVGKEEKKLISACAEKAKEQNDDYIDPDNKDRMFY